MATAACDQVAERGIALPLLLYQNRNLMAFVSEVVIERVLDTLATTPPDRYEVLVVSFAEAQPVLAGWLVSDSFDILTEAEREYLLYLALIVWKAALEAQEVLPRVDEARISELEEHNWTILNSTQGKTFRDRLTPFFEAYPQEDLLAFVEDALAIDEFSEQEELPEQVVTREGREPLFIGLKTMIDALLVAPPTKG